MSDSGVMTPYSTVKPLFQDEPIWVPEMERERLSAYDTYERIYWSVPKAFKLAFRGTNDKPIYVPNARTVVNETSHYLLKGLSILPGKGGAAGALGTALDAFLKRERFYSKFHTAKTSGVARGDWVMHLTADPSQPEGRRLSLSSVDPSSYFPIWDDDDLDKRIGVDLVEMILQDDGSTLVKKLRYTYDTEGSTRRVVREEVLLELDGWWKGEAAKVKQTILPSELLPPEIDSIPVYHFKNIDWQGDPFGSSELRGFETLLASIDQTISDEELALALEGLGCYATDAPTPTDDNGDEEAWEIAPGKVLELPSGSSFNRVGGLSSVKPALDHIQYLTNSLFEGTSTFRNTAIDVQLAESGVALAIRFLPTLAKLEQRDLHGLDVLNNLFFDWKAWHKAYEGEDLQDQDILVSIGEKLPTNRTDVLNELNNMLDRNVISRAYYRQEMEKLGYKFSSTIQQEILDEQQALNKVKPQPVVTVPNNGNKPNESAGTEATQPTTAQQRPKT